MGVDRRQYRADGQRLYTPRRHRGEMIGDNTERKDRSYTKQEFTEGGGSATISKAEAIQTKKAQRGEDR